VANPVGLLFHPIGGTEYHVGFLIPPMCADSGAIGFYVTPTHFSPAHIQSEVAAMKEIIAATFRTLK
jgi:hypothetical protein